MFRTTELRIALAELVIFYFVAVRETRSGPALTLDPNEETEGFFESDPEGPTVHLPGSEVALRLCINGLPPELINVRFGDGKSLLDFPVNRTGPLPAVGVPASGEDRQRVPREADKSRARQTLPVSNENPRRHKNLTDDRNGSRKEGTSINESEISVNENEISVNGSEISVNGSETSSEDRDRPFQKPELTFNPETHDRSTTDRSSNKKNAERTEKPPSGLTAYCPTVIRHSYAKPGLYRIEAEVVRPENLTLAFSPAWVRISSFAFLVGQVLLFNRFDRLVTLETAHFLAAVHDVPFPLLAEVDFGDSTPIKRVELSKNTPVPEWVPNVLWLARDYRTGTCYHGYAYPGTYNITLKVSPYQPETGIGKAEVVTAQTTLTVETFAQRIGDHLLFYHPGVRTFPREDFEVVAMVERLLSNTRVDLDFGDGTPSVNAQLQRTTTARPEWTRLNETDHYYWTLVKHRFSVSGAFQMKMVVRMTDVSESMLVYFCPVVVYDFLFDVKDVRLLLPIAEGQSQTKVTMGESVMFTILIRSRPEADLEVLVDFGDGTERQNISYTSVALASLPEEALYNLPDANHVGYAHHTYSSRGVFEARVFVTNVELKRFWEATFSAGISVEVLPCSSLSVWIGGIGVQRVYGRWEDFVLEAYLAPGCEDDMKEGGGRGSGEEGATAATGEIRAGGGSGETEEESSGSGGEELRRGRRRTGRGGMEGGIEGGGEELRGAGKMDEEDEVREDEGTGELQKARGGGEGGGGEDKDGVGGIQGRWGGGGIGRGFLVEWKLLRIGPSSVAETAWPAYPKSTGFEIHLPPYSLPVGEYQFQIELTQLSLDDARPVGRAANSTKVRITSMNFKVDVEPETQRIGLSIGYVTVFEAVIDPEMEDWDELDQLIFYEWFCVTQKLSDVDLDLSDDPGCYSEGSKMNETTSLLGIEPKSLVFKKLPAVYYVYARVTRSDRRVTSLPAELWLEAKSELNVTIVCFINCGTFLSADEALTLSYTCSNCNRPSNLFPQLFPLSSSYSSSHLSSASFSTSSFSSSSASSFSFSSSSFLPKDRNMSFSWALEPPGTGINLTRDSLTGSQSDWLIVRGLAFYENLTSENRTYHIKLAITDRLQSHGRTSYTVSVSARLKPSSLARGTLPSRASSLLILNQGHLLPCVIVIGFFHKWQCYEQQHKLWH